MKLLLGLDGLDYDLVKKWDCMTLMQRQFGQFKVPINPNKGYPLSPEVWASILSGEEVKGGSLEFTVEGKLGDGRRRVVNALTKLQRVLPIRGLGLGKRIARPHGFPKYPHPLFIDEGWCFWNAPFRSYDEAVFKLDFQWSQGDFDWQGYTGKVLELYETRKQGLLASMHVLKRAERCFCYVEFPDGIEHMLYMNMEALHGHYMDLDGFVKHLLELLEPELCLIVSDHGFDLSRKCHSDLAYYSCSSPLVGLESSTDVARIVKEW